MTEDIAGSCVSRCPLSRMVVVRVCTLNTDVLDTESFVGQRWDAQIMISFAEANRIFNRYGIAVLRGERDDVSINKSQQILASSSVDQEYLSNMRDQRYVDQVLQRGALNDTENNRFPITEEVNAVLALHRGARHDVHSYWTPFSSFYGKTYHNVEYPALQNEGIIIRRDVHMTTLAHELGHLLTRSGHVDFVAPYGEGELETSNLMWEYNESRLPACELNETQLSVVRQSEYVRPYERRRRRPRT